MPAVGGLRWSGVCLLSTHILWPVTQGCIPGESDGIQQENWEVLTRLGARMKATVAPCHAGVCRESKTRSKPQANPHTEGKLRRNNPSWEGIPGLSSARPC